MAVRTITTKLALDGEAEYRAKIKNLNADLALHKSELERVQAQYKDHTNRTRGGVMLTGDKIKITPTLEGRAGAEVTATVVYIHPKRRYYVAEYRGADGTPLRETFPFRHRQGR